jgi:hypothetical protein
VQNRKKNATAALDALIRGEISSPLGTGAQTKAPDEIAEADASTVKTASFSGS